MYEFKKSDAFEFTRHVGLEGKEKNGQLHLKYCPYCKGGGSKDRGSFAIDLQTGKFKCLRNSCGVTGNMITLSRDFDFSLGHTVDEYYRPRKEFRKLKQPKEKIVPKPAAVAYLESRGISQEVAEKYEITVQQDHDNVLVFPFYDEKGIMQFVKYRKTDFDKSRDKNKEWCEANCKPILFGMKQCNGKFDRLVVVEGQLDQLAVATAGIENAVSVPTGSKGFTWIPYCWNWVSRFREIIVFGDYENGTISLLEDLQKRFKNKIKHVRESDYTGCKDANEILLKHGAAQVRKCVEQAVSVPVNRVIQLADVETVNIYKLPKLKTGMNNLDKVLYGGIPFGIVAIIAGKRGKGKSTVASQIVLNAIEQDYPVFAYSGELPNYLFKSWLDFQIAGPNHIIEDVTESGRVNRYISKQNQGLINDWYRDKFYLYDNGIIDSDEKEDLLGTIEECICRYGTKVILIDNLMTAMYVDEKPGTDKYDKQGYFVRQLTRLALKYNVLVLLVAHRRKNNFSDDVNDEISGSGDITNLAGLTLSYDTDSDLQESQRRLIVAKNRLFGRIYLEGFVMDYDEKSKRIYGPMDDLDREYGWCEQVDGFVSTDQMEIPF